MALAVLKSKGVPATGSFPANGIRVESTGSTDGQDMVVDGSVSFASQVPEGVIGNGSLNISVFQEIQVGLFAVNGFLKIFNL